ncbi:Rne/Rng family ribonuclease [Marinilongibacter aquaticus]|uniref:Rne/Rng family ribonuclease n=1 Tax=Marinilongibacter aquaticus TaxID=2975157 RepID=UPI0021BDE8B4|nr:Rne/Rng family ribonuclease [Marinilongibacter aquaticus]UBM60521.1 Rne/Rng family ribonuclease [Marinilongibacter aquaticus]
MSNELYISSTEKGERIALMQDRRLIEYHIDQAENQFSVGDIYLGTVKKVVSGLNAAFIDIGYEKDAFLHYHDLSPNIRSLNTYTKGIQNKKPFSPRLKGFRLQPQIDKLGKITDVLTKGQPILVQVVKEPISSKGPRLSCDISIAGRYVVLVPFANAVNISKKITSKQERQRLHKMLNSVKPENFGIIVRTVAENKGLDELQRDLEECVEKWESGIRALKKARPRDRIVSEMNRAASLLRDLLNDDFDNVIVDSRNNFSKIKSLLQTIAPEKANILKLHTAKTKLFEQHGIEKQLKSLFGRSVSLPNGGYLIIEHTEALHVIDVNSGNKSTKEEDQEATALNVNLEAAKEIARQLRLRDMGGIVVVDFIDMKKAQNRKEVNLALKSEMKADRSKYTVLPITKFGLAQITRQRVRPEMNIVTKEKCPTCNGTGSIQASIAVTDLLENHLDHLLEKQNERKITIILHPFLYAYYREGLVSRQMKWFFKYRKWVKLVKDSSLGVTDFHFLNSLGEEIELNG